MDTEKTWQLLTIKSSHSSHFLSNGTILITFKRNKIFMTLPKCLQGLAHLFQFFIPILTLLTQFAFIFNGINESSSSYSKEKFCYNRQINYYSEQFSRFQVNFKQRTGQNLVAGSFWCVVSSTGLLHHISSLLSASLNERRKKTGVADDVTEGGGSQSQFSISFFRPGQGDCRVGGGCLEVESVIRLRRMTTEGALFVMWGGERQNAENARWVFGTCRTCHCGYDYA